MTGWHPPNSQNLKDHENSSKSSSDVQERRYSTLKFWYQWKSETATECHHLLHIFSYLHNLFVMCTTYLIIMFTNNVLWYLLIVNVYVLRTRLVLPDHTCSGRGRCYASPCRPGNTLSTRSAFGAFLFDRKCCYISIAIRSLSRSLGIDKYYCPEINCNCDFEVSSKYKSHLRSTKNPESRLKLIGLLY